MYVATGGEVVSHAVGLTREEAESKGEGSWRVGSVQMERQGRDAGVSWSSCRRSRQSLCQIL